MLALQEALEILQNAHTEDAWDHQDDRCDCTFQRIGYWSNPYIGETLEVRMCCIWKELYKQFPEYVRVTKGEPAQWNGEADMPRSIWVRQLANETGLSVSEARCLNLEPPKGQPRREPTLLYLNSPWGWVPLELGG